MAAESPEILPADLIQVGRVIGAYGLQGWVKVQAFAADDTVLATKPAVWLDHDKSVSERPSQALAPSRVKQLRMHGSDYLVQFETVGDRDAAERLKAARIWVSRSAFPSAQDGEYYWIDLIGCAVTNQQSVQLGYVVAIEDHGADPVLRVEVPAEPAPVTDPAILAGSSPARATATKPLLTRLIPFVDAYVINVDLAKRQVTVDWDAQWVSD